MAMQEYRDGSFGEIVDAGEGLKKLSQDVAEIENTRAVHIGTKEELEQIKSGNAKRIMNKLDQLERKLNRVIIHFGIEVPGEVLVVD